jgi:cell division control protein 6
MPLTSTRSYVIGDLFHHCTGLFNLRSYPALINGEWSETVVYINTSFTGSWAGGRGFRLMLLCDRKRVMLVFHDGGPMPSFEERSQRIISDFGKLDFDYVPEQLVHRDAAKNQIFDVMRTAVETGSNQRLYITGSVGTGKSALSKRFCIDFKEWARERGQNCEYAIANCRARNTPASVLLKVIERFQPHFPDRGFSTTEMLEILRKQVTKDSVHLIIVLDEVDVLVKKSGPDLLYGLSRFDEDRIKSQRNSLSLILISQRRFHDFLDAATLSTLKRTNQVNLERYSKEELYDILKQRVDLAFYSGTVGDEAIEFIADIASEFGDARFAIELLENAGRIANEDGTEIVMPEHIRSAKAMTYSFVTESKLVSLNRQNTLTLLAVSRAIKDRAFVTTGEVEEVYALVCEEFGEDSRGHTQFWGYLHSLGDLGLVGLSSSGKGMVGKTTIISLPDIPAKVLEEKLLDILGSKG